MTVRIDRMVLSGLCVQLHSKLIYRKNESCRLLCWLLVLLVSLFMAKHVLLLCAVTLQELKMTCVRWHVWLTRWWSSTACATASARFPSRTQRSKVLSDGVLSARACRSRWTTWVLTWALVLRWPTLTHCACQHIELCLSPLITDALVFANMSLLENLIVIPPVYFR